MKTKLFSSRNGGPDVSRDAAASMENKHYGRQKKKGNSGKFFSRFYVFVCLAFFYLPILVTMFFSFNSSKSLTKFSGFSLRWYQELLQSSEISKAVYVSVTIAILATVISTVLGTITAIGLTRSRKVVKELLLNVNNLPILNPDIVTAISLMLLFYLLVW